MLYEHDTYDRRIQLGASRRRREDAESLHHAGRWAGAIYLGGYAIECSLKALICSNESKNNLKDTRMFKHAVQGATLHRLTHLLRALPQVQRAIELDRTGQYKTAWDTVTRLWQSDALRYWDRLGDQSHSTRFIEAMQQLHRFILEQQGASY